MYRNDGSARELRVTALERENAMLRAHLTDARAVLGAANDHVAERDRMRARLRELESELAIHRAPIGSEADAAIGAIARGVVETERRAPAALVHQAPISSHHAHPVVHDVTCEPIVRGEDRAAAYAIAAFMSGLAAGALLVGALVVLAQHG